MRIVEHATPYRGVRHAGHCQRRVHRIDALGTQVLVRRIHDAIDAKLERRVTGEVRRDLGRGIPVRYRNVRGARVEREVAIFGPASDRTNRTLRAHRPGRSLHALRAGQTGATDAARRYGATFTGRTTHALDAGTAGAPGGSGRADQGRALDTHLTRRTWRTGRSGGTRRAGRTSDTVSLSAHLSGRALRTGGANRAGRPTSADHDGARRPRDPGVALRTWRTGRTHHAGGTCRAVTGGARLAHRALRPGRTGRAGEAGRADQTRLRRRRRRAVCRRAGCSLGGRWRGAAGRGGHRERR